MLATSRLTTAITCRKLVTNITGEMLATSRLTTAITCRNVDNIYHWRNVGHKSFNYRNDS